MSTTSNIKGAFDSLLAAASLTEHDNNDFKNTSAASTKKKGYKNRRSQGFPQKLYNILQKEHKSIISWTSRNGDAIVVRDTDRFATDILPRYFRHTKVRACVLLLVCLCCITLGPNLHIHNLTLT